MPKRRAELVSEPPEQQPTKKQKTKETNDITAETYDKLFIHTKDILAFLKNKFSLTKAELLSSVHFVLGRFSEQTKIPITIIEEDVKQVTLDATNTKRCGLIMKTTVWRSLLRGKMKDYSKIFASKFFQCVADALNYDSIKNMITENVGKEIQTSLLSVVKAPFKEYEQLFILMDDACTFFSKETNLQLETPVVKNIMASIIDMFSNKTGLQVLKVQKMDENWKSKILKRLDEFDANKCCIIYSGSDESVKFWKETIKKNRFKLYSKATFKKFFKQVASDLGYKSYKILFKEKATKFSKKSKKQKEENEEAES